MTARQLTPAWDHKAATWYMQNNRTIPGDFRVEIGQEIINFDLLLTGKWLRDSRKLVGLSNQESLRGIQVVHSEIRLDFQLVNRPAKSRVLSKTK